MKKWLRPSFESVMTGFLTFFLLACLGLFIAAIYYAGDAGTYNSLMAASGISTVGAASTGIPLAIRKIASLIHERRRTLEGKKSDLDSKAGEAEASIERGYQALEELKKRKDEYQELIATGTALLGRVQDIDEPLPEDFKDGAKDSSYAKAAKEYQDNKELKESYQATLDDLEAKIAEIDKIGNRIADDMSEIENLAKGIVKLSDDVMNESKSLGSLLPSGEGDTGSDGDEDSADSSGAGGDSGAGDDIEKGNTGD